MPQFRIFGAIEITPLWKKQREEEESLFITLPIALFGMSISFWIFPILLTSKFNNSFLDRVDQSSPFINTIFSQVWINSIIGIFVASISLLFLLNVSSVFKEVKYKDQINILYDSILQTLLLQDEDQDIKEIKKKATMIFFGDFAMVFILGYLAGIYYSILLYIPIYLIYLLITLILINFTNLSMAVTISMIFSWLIVYNWLIKRKISFEDKPMNSIDPEEDYGLSNRAAEIIMSNQPPVICSGCRSYVASTRKYCNICGEEIN